MWRSLQRSRLSVIAITQLECVNKWPSSSDLIDSETVFLVQDGRRDGLQS